MSVVITIGDGRAAVYTTFRLGMKSETAATYDYSVYIRPQSTITATAGEVFSLVISAPGNTSKAYSVQVGASYEANTTYTLLNGSVDISYYTGSTEFAITVQTQLNASVIESQQYICTPFPEVSGLSATPWYFGDTVQISISRPEHATSMHDEVTLRCYCTANTGDIETITTDYTGDTYNWTIPARFESYLSSTTAYGYVVVECVGYSARYGYGTTKKQFQVYSTSALPQISYTLTELNTDIPAGITAYIKGQSQIRADITVTTTKANTVIQRVRVVFDGVEKYASGAGSAWTARSNILQNAGNRTIEITAWDSNGLTRTVSITIPVEEYIPPTFDSVALFRCAAADDDTPDMQGSYACVSITGSITPLNNSNTHTAVIYWKKTTDNSYQHAEITVPYAMQDYTYIFAADPNSLYDVYLTMTDVFSTTTYTCAPLGTIGALVDINEHGAGIAFGKLLTRSNHFEIGWPTHIFDSLEVDGTLTALDATDNTALLTAPDVAPLRWANTVNTDTFIPLIKADITGGSIIFGIFPSDKLFGYVQIQGTSVTKRIIQ